MLFSITYCLTNGVQFTYSQDSVIPTEKELSDMFDISRTTVRQAIIEMVQEGWLYRVKSKGTFVSQPKINQDFIQKLESYNEQIRKTGKIPHTEVLDFKVIQAMPEVANRLNIQLGDKIIYLHRKRYADNEPIVILKTYLPYEQCSFVMEHDLEKESLYSILSGNNSVKIHYMKRLVEAVEATASDAENLNMKKGKPIQLFTSVGFNVFNEPIEFSSARYRGDRSCFEVTVCTEN